MWTRKIDRKPLRLVIYLSPDEDELLYRWLETIPYGKTSKSIREVLRSYLSGEVVMTQEDNASVEPRDERSRQADNKAILEMADRIRSLHEL